MSNILDSILKQYENNKSSGGGGNFEKKKVDLTKYFAPFLPKGESNGERTIRILPTQNGDSPFTEAWFHEIQVDGKWQKLYDPGKNDGERSPITEVNEALLMTGDPEDRVLARQYKPKKFYIVKVIDRDREDEGVKFWRFKHNYKGDGIMDKLIPLFQKRGDITDPREGRDINLILKSVKMPSGKGSYTSVSTIMVEDPSILTTDVEKANTWVGHSEIYKDVYSKKDEQFLEKVAKGENPYERKEERSTPPAPTTPISNTTISELDQGTEINMDDMPF
tara:strand:- start:10189 stop:11022 length:834 start_codon:yes stop_codon:yes gene_type:complete